MTPSDDTSSPTGRRYALICPCRDEAEHAQATNAARLATLDAGGDPDLAVVTPEAGVRPGLRSEDDLAP